MFVWNDFRTDARVLKEAQTLQRSGYRVTVFALAPGGDTAKRETLAGGIKVVRTALWLSAPASGTAPLRTEVRSSGGTLRRLRLVGMAARRSLTHLAVLTRMVRMHPDVIHSHDVNTLPTAWLAARLTGAALVYDAHELSTSREGYDGGRKLIGAVESLIIARAQGTITTTNARAKYLARAYSVGRPLVLQNRPRRHTVEPSTLLRDTLGLPAEQPIILYQGVIQQGRGLELLASAAKTVTNASFVFIGSGRMLASLKAQVAREGTGDRVKFVPTVPLDQLPRWTMSADIGIQAVCNTCFNHFTTDSNKLFEYIMAGLPVIASNLPEIRAVIEASGAGLLVPAGDQGELTAAIQRLVDDPTLRAGLARNAVRAAGSLSWESQEHHLAELYRNILLGRA